MAIPKPGGSAFLLIGAVLILLPALLYGQTPGAHLVIEYADDEFEVRFLDETGSDVAAGHDGGGNRVSLFRGTLRPVVTSATDESYLTRTPAPAAGPARKRHLQAGGFGTVVLPSGDMADVCGPGLGAGGEIYYRPGAARVGTRSSGNPDFLPAFGAVFEYITFSGTAPDVKAFSTFTAAGSVEYRLPLLPFAGLLLHGRAGFGYSTLTYKDSAAEDRDPVTDFHPYLGVGAGLETGFSRAVFYLSGLYRFILEEDFTPYHGISIQAGVRVGFSGPQGRDEEYTP